MDRLVNKKVFFELNKRISDEEFKDLRILCVVRCGKLCIYVTKEDKVYCFGYNDFGCLGLGLTDVYIDSPQLNTTLSDKQLVDIGFGWDHCIGLTRSGQCYSWGGNKFGQLGNCRDEMSATPRLIASLADKRIAKISCGNAHNLALTESGQVYAWGRNFSGQCGFNGHPICYEPSLVEFDDQILSISSGKAHSVALTVGGLVYVWGSNTFGQLGRMPILCADTQKPVWSRKPLLLETLVNKIVIKAVCGSTHTLLLTSEGDIYSFGNSECGQVGNGQTSIQYIPVRVNGTVKFKDMATSCKCDTCVGQSVTNDYYVWGSVWFPTDVSQPNVGEKKLVLSPQKLMKDMRKSLIDVFAKYGERRITYKAVVNTTEDIRLWDQMIAKKEKNRTNNCVQESTSSAQNSSFDTIETQINALNVNPVSQLKNISNDSDFYYSSDDSSDSNEKPIVSRQSKPMAQIGQQIEQSLNSGPNPIMNCVIASFNNQKNSDFIFIIENQYIYGHKDILRFRNRKFWQKCENYLNANKEQFIRINCYSYKTFYAFIQYLYTNSVDIDIESAGGLITLANVYDEIDLENRCRQLFVHNIDVRNVCVMYIKALELNSKELEKYCIEFVSKHMKQICLTQDFKNMNDSLAKNLMIKASKM